jgi:hypothetical protein
MDQLSFDGLEDPNAPKRRPPVSGLSFDQVGGAAVGTPGMGGGTSDEAFGDSETFFDTPKTTQPRTDTPSAPGGQAPTSTTTPSPSIDRARQSAEKLRTTTDSRQRAMLEDEIARTAADELRRAGRDVSFDGDRMMVDGRPYVIGDGQANTHSQTGNQFHTPAAPQASDLRTQGTPAASGTLVQRAQFDAAGYLAANPDVAAAMRAGRFNGDPYAHYTQYGFSEGRQGASAPTGAPSATPVSGPYTPPDSSGWKTDGYAAPQFTPTATGPAMPGWDQTKFADPNHQTPKYGVGRILQQFPPTVAGLTQALPQIQKAYPGTTFNGKDKLTIPVGDGRVLTIDALQGASQGGGAWQWIDLDAAAAAAGSAPGGTGGLPPETGGYQPAPSGAPGAAGVPTGSGPTSGGGAGGGRFATSGPTYQPGDIGTDDLDGFDLNSLMELFGGNSPAAVDQLDDTYQAGQVDTPKANLRSLDTDYAAGQVDTPKANLRSLDTDYADGRVSNDPLRTYSFDGLEELGPLGGGPVGDQTEAGLLELLRNPSSLDDRTVSMLKAKSREELAGEHVTDDEELQAIGREMGIDDSNWLASERMASRRGRDEAITRSNRDVEVRAAETRAADKRSALGLGTSFSDSQASQKRADAALKLERELAEEGLSQAEIDSEMRAAGFKREGEVLNEGLRGEAFDRRQTATDRNNQTTLQGLSFDREGQVINEGLRGEAFDRTTKVAQQNIDNMFRSREDQRAAQTLATNASLNAAAQRGDRMALRESIKQEATKLGIAADQVQLNYTLGLLDDATRRYGIDVGAQIDREKLSQAGREFQEDLAFRLKALAQADAQFGAQWGLDAAKFEHGADMDNWDRYTDFLSPEE